MNVPRSLRTWFSIHFFVDVLFGIPLFVIPQTTMDFFGLSSAEPIIVRLVAAALFGIGGISWIYRNASVEVYQSLLALKIIWSLFALLAIGISLIWGASPMVWFIFSAFAVFSGVWIYFAWKIRF